MAHPLSACWLSVRRLSVRWTVTPLSAPRPRLFCGGCGQTEAFESSGKFRLNANGKRLDAWLLYRCGHCGTTWKRPLLERRSLRRLPADFLRALERNDPDLAEKFAFDLEDLRRHAREIEIFSELSVQKEVTGSPPAGAADLEILIALPHATAVRTDRLLSRELGISRKRLTVLEREKRLTTILDAPYRLRKPLADGLRIRIDLSSQADAARIVARASGQKTESPTGQ